MPWIRFIKPDKKDFEVAAGSQLMKSILQQGYAVASSCKGEGICSKCRMRVVEGKEGLSPIESQEDILMKKNGLSFPWRISCQAHVLADVTVDTGYW